jgi:hypothetical protein
MPITFLLPGPEFPGDYTWHLDQDQDQDQKGGGKENRRLC